MKKTNCTVLFFLAIAGTVFAQDWGEVKKEFREQWGTKDLAKRTAAVRALSSHDHTEASILLFDHASETEKFVRELEKQKEAVQAEMLKYPADPISIQLASRKKAVVDEGNKKLKKRQALDRQQQELQARIEEHDGVLRAIAETVGKYRSEGAVRTALKEFRRERLPHLQVFLPAAVGAFPGGEAERALIGVAEESKDFRVVVACLEALSKRGGEAALETAVAMLERGEWQVQRGAAEALFQMDDVRGIGPLIAALEKADGRMRDEFNIALVGLTGENKHGDVSAWKAWWDRAKDGFAEKRAAKPERMKVLQAAWKGADVRGGTTFYGIPINSKRVVFVLDRSGSMALKADWKPSGEVATGAGGEPEECGDRKIDVCRYELRRAIRMLAEDARFNIVFYNRDRMMLSSGGLVKATDAGKKKAIAFVDQVEPLGATNIYDSLEKAMGFDLSGKVPEDQVDTVFLLSDGLPNCGQHIAPATIRKGIRELNAKSRIHIHTIYVGGGTVAADLMKLLAKENEGVFVDRSKPDK